MFRHPLFATLRLRIRTTWFVAAVVAAGAVQASALNIVITDDDGFETNNIQTLFAALKSAGHDVILSAPYVNQSGASAHAAFVTPIKPTTSASAKGKLPAGSPGTGPTTIAADQYYVDGSPVTAVLYGIDVLAKAKWGKAPDLVISGPNVGPNLGVGIPHSGTVGAAITAINKGIPAMAVNAFDDNATAAPLVAQITLRVLSATLRQGKVSLPAGTGLNVNLPRLDSTKTAADYPCAFTQIGVASDFGLQFFEHLGESSFAVSAGMPAGTSLPGVSLVAPYTNAGYSADNHATSEANVLAAGGTVTVSPIQGTYQAAADKAAAILSQMSSLFPSSTVVTAPKLVNSSARAAVGTGASVQIMGFVISGDSPKTVLVRAAGPALTPFGVNGVLVDPQLELYSGQLLLGSNDNWSDDSTQAAAIETAASRSGAWAWTRGTKDAALLTTLTPGAYTVIVKGVGGSSGIVLTEVLDAGLN